MGVGMASFFSMSKVKNRITFGGAVCIEKYKTLDFYTFLDKKNDLLS